MNESIGLRIKEIRVKNNLPQEEFAEILGIKQPNLSHIENKGKKITLDIIMKIISNFNIDSNWLLKGTIGEMLPNSSKTNEKCKVCTEKERVILQQEELIKTKNKLIAKLEQEINETKKQSEMVAKTVICAAAG